MTALTETWSPRLEAGALERCVTGWGFVFLGVLLVAEAATYLVTTLVCSQKWASFGNTGQRGGQEE